MAIKWGRNKKGSAPAAPPGPIAITERKRVALLGGGYPLPLWEKRLAGAQIEFSLSTTLAPDELAKTEFETLIETEGFSQSSAGGESELEVAVQAPALVPGGIVLVPCYGASPTQMASMLGDLADRSAGYTLFPAPSEDPNVQPIIELARPMQTRDDAWERAVAFLEEAGFHVEFAGDSPGLIFGRTLACLINEAAFALSEGIASAEDIDAAMRLGVNYPKGPFAWADELGLDLVLDILEGLASHYEEDRYRPAPLLKHWVAAEKKFFA